MCDRREITALRKVPGNEAVGVFVESPFPKGVRRSKVEIRPKGFGDSFMLRKFLPIVCGERMDVLPQWGNKKVQDGLGDLISFLIGNRRSSSFLKT